MARPAGTKMVKCSKPKCKGMVVALPGETATCKTCGAKTRLTKAYLASLVKK